MFEPAKPPRVASNVAPVTRVSVRAARGIVPAAIPIPLSVVRFDAAPDPRIDAPELVIVTPDIVAASAVRSPAIVGGSCPLTPSLHFSDAPASTLVGVMLLLARTGRTAVVFI